MTDRPQFIKFPYHFDDRGVLTVAEAQQHTPFEIKRVFWITQVPPGKARAGHSHTLCHQILIAVKGTVDVKIDNGLFILAGSDTGLYIPPNNYIELTRFTENAILLVLCSHHYNEED